MADERKTVVNNLFWRFMERCGAQIVTFLVSVVLARILDPEAYGTVALVTVFTTLLQVFVDGGMANALIQKKNADDLDFSSVFYFNMVLCLVLYGAMFLAAPLVSAFYDKPYLTPIVRVMSLVIIISGLKNVQQAYVSRNMLFKRFFYSTIGGTIFSAAVGIYMAVKGYGVWALVGQNLVNVGASTVILWFTVKWRPKLQFSFARLKALLSYGWKLLVAKLLDTVYHDLRQLIIGKIYTSEDLAFYNQAKQFPHVVVTNINTTIDSVLLPTMSNIQDEKDRLRRMTRRAIKVSTFIMMPIMMGLAVCAEPVVKIVLTEKWLPCVPFLQIFCFSYAFRPVQTANLNAIKALGRSDLFLKLEILKKAVGLISILITMNISVMAMTYSLLVTTVLMQIINSWPNKSLLGYSYINQVWDMLPQIILSCIMGVGVYCINLFALNAWLTLIIQVPLGIVIYVLGSKAMKIDSFGYVLDIIKSYTGKIKKRKS